MVCVTGAVSVLHWVRGVLACAMRARTCRVGLVGGMVCITGAALRQLCTGCVLCLLVPCVPVRVVWDSWEGWCVLLALCCVSFALGMWRA